MITRQLLEKGESVRILVRHNSPSEELAKQGLATLAQSLIDAGTQPVNGDLKDRPSLDKACGGIETVITTATAALRGGENTFESVDLNGTKSLIDAAQAAGVKHFVYTSLAGSDINHPSPLFRAKATCEAHLKGSDMDYTILKPHVFMEVWIGTVVGMPLQARQPVTLVGQGDHKQAFVSMADVTTFAVAAVDNPAARNASILIAGPASHSWMQVVETVGRVLGQELPVNYVAPGDPVPLIPEGMGAMLAGMEMGETYIDMSETAPTYGVALTSLDAFAQRFFGGGSG